MPRLAKTSPEAPASTPATSTESIDAQTDRVFEAVCAQIERGELKDDDEVTMAALKRQHGVSAQAAALAFKRLKDLGLLSNPYHAPSTPMPRAQAIARELAAMRETATAADVPPAFDPTAANTGMPPWLAGGTPVRLPPEMRRAALASRRFPQPVESRGATQTWLEVQHQLKFRIDLEATDAALRPAAQRMFDRVTAAPSGSAPDPDVEADTLLLALALGIEDHADKNDTAGSVVSYLVAQYGMPETTDILLAVQRIEVGTEYDLLFETGRSGFSHTVTHPITTGWLRPLGRGEQMLRRQLAAATPEDWQVCRDKIEAALPQLHPCRRPAVAMLLPDAPEISNALAIGLATQRGAGEMLHWLLSTATEPAAIALAVKARLSASSGFWSHEGMVATLVQERGTDAVDLLARGATCDEAADGLVTIGTPEAVQALARVASSSKATLARFSLSVDRWPLAAIAGLSRMVAAGSKDANLVLPSLTRLLRAHGTALPALRPWLDAGAQGVIDRQLALLSNPTEIANASELPVVLTAPPWLAKVQKKAVATLALAPLALASTEHWDEAERKEMLHLSQWRLNHHSSAQQDVRLLLAGLGYDLGEPQVRPLIDAAIAAIAASDADALIANWRAMLAECKKYPDFRFRFEADYTVLLPAAIGVPFWNAIAGEAEDYGIGRILATHGLAVLSGFLAKVHAKPGENLALALHFGAVELALPAARAFAKLKTLRATGRTWLLKYPEHAACGLMAPALGKAGEARDATVSALHLLRANGHEALLLDVAARYGKPEVMEALRAVLDESPLDRFPTKRAKLPEFWQPKGWRRPTLKNGKALPDDALDHLGQMLTFPTNEEVYAGIAVVKEACDADTLADFAWDAFTAWLEASGPSKEGWALTSLGLLGNDDIARRLTPFIRAWPGEAAHARAVTGLDVLAAIGSDVALMLLNGIAQKVKFKGLQDKAREKIDTIAEARGLTTEELEDRLAPDLGLDEQGTMLLDFGPRAFKVGFDESLKPYVRERADGVDGARLPDLPKPKKTDDEALSKEAVERFKLLKKDARTIASQQLLRLEVAMCARRRWSPEVFRTFLVEHPLVRHLVQRLIWGAYEVEGDSSYGGTLKACFRVAEDGSFTTAEDDPFELPAGDNVRIGVPHALDLAPADAAAFGQVFADYELLQPFAQIGRDIYTLTEEEKKSDKLERWKNAKVPTGRVLGLVNKGWRRGEAQDGGGIWYFTKPLGVDRVIELYLDPGIIVGMVDENPEQALGDVQVGKPSSNANLQDAEELGKLDPISASELIRDLEGLRA